MSNTTALRLQVQKNAGGTGIFWQKEPQKVENKKFGYKSKSNKFPLRKPDNEETMNEIEAMRRADNKKFNRNNKDFINKNRNRYKVKEPKSQDKTDTSIKPGTVTLTQEQLAALLATLSSEKDQLGDGLRISIDSSNNKIEVEKYSDSVENDVDNASEVVDNRSEPGGVYDLLQNGAIEKRRSRKSDFTEAQKKLEKEEAKNPSTVRSSLELAKQEAGVDNISPIVPWKHLTVAERKRLQWAREKAEAEDTYDPWGRPGAGAPTVKPEEPVREDRRPETEQVKTESYDKQNVEAIEAIMKKYGLNHTEPSTTDQQKKREQEEEVAAISKKELERRKWLAELDKQREEQRLMKQKEKERERQGEDKWADRFVYHKSPEHASPRHPSIRIDESQKHWLGETTVDVEDTVIPPAAMRSSMVVGTGTLNDSRYENKKAEERKKWLGELQKQVEEQRAAKAAAKKKIKEEEISWVDQHRSEQDLAHTVSLGHTGHMNPASLEGEITLDDTKKVRISSAPQHIPEADVSGSYSPEEPNNFLRGKGTFVDPVTRKEQEEKRKVYLEYQAQVKAQIEEKERKKKEERERKMREDMEEERKLQAERERMIKQEEMEMERARQKERQREREVAALKSAMDEAHERAMEEKNIRRMHRLQRQGHDVSQLKATYEDFDQVPSSHNISKGMTPRLKDFSITDLPGTDNTPVAQYESSYNLINSRQARASPSPTRAVVTHSRMNARDARPMGESYTKEPYTENRVLTPTLYRSGQLDSSLGSPNREFGTQTLELKDLKAILQSLPDEVQIEYKAKVEEALKEKEKPQPTRKQAPKKPPATNQTQQKADFKSRRNKAENNSDRPLWNARRKTAIVKNSEKDPFYEQKRERSEQRRANRERQLQYLQELNKERIPASVSPPRNQTEKLKTKTLPPKSRIESHSKVDLLPTTELENIDRSSPPIPSVRRKIAEDKQVDQNTYRQPQTHADDKKVDPYQYANKQLQKYSEDKYGGSSPERVVTQSNEFLPFHRTAEILDPSKAEEELVVSRENSRMERARKAYYENHNVASHGTWKEAYLDRDREAALRDPIMNPGLVTKHPSNRQDVILQQLSSLKQTLMMRQREIETNMEAQE